MSNLGEWVFERNFYKRMNWRTKGKEKNLWGKKLIYKWINELTGHFRVGVILRLLRDNSKNICHAIVTPLYFSFLLFPGGLRISEPLFVITLICHVRNFKTTPLWMITIFSNVMVSIFFVCRQRKWLILKELPIF